MAAAAQRFQVVKAIDKIANIRRRAGRCYRVLSLTAHT